MELVPIGPLGYYYCIRGFTIIFGVRIYPLHVLIHKQKKKKKKFMDKYTLHLISRYSKHAWPTTHGAASIAGNTSSSFDNVSSIDNTSLAGMLYPVLRLQTSKTSSSYHSQTVILHFMFDFDSVKICVIYCFLLPQERITIYDYIFSKFLIVNFCLKAIKPKNCFKFLYGLSNIM